MTRICSIRFLFPMVRMLMVGCLAMSSVFSFVEYPGWQCDGSERHLQAHGRIHTHHHPVNHDNEDDAGDTASAVIFIKENSCASLCGFSKINFSNPYPYNFCFGSIIRWQASGLTPGSNLATVDHSPIKVYLYHCSLLI